MVDRSNFVLCCRTSAVATLLRDQPMDRAPRG